MHKKILLTSARAICIAVPAVAEPTVSATFPDVYVDGNKIDVKKTRLLLAPVRTSDSDTITGDAEIWIVD